MQSILVTGGSGFIGSHLARRLAGRGAMVHVLHRGTSNLRRLADVPARLWECDLLDTERLRAVLEEVQPNAIFHLAGDSSVRHFDDTFAGVMASVDGNVRSALNLLVTAANAALPELRVVIRMGGLEEYGHGPMPYDEQQREVPVSPYSASQVAVTHYWQMLAPRLAFRTLTARPALIYGPDQARTFLIPSLIASCLENRDFELRGARQGRDLLYIDDLIDALVLLLDGDVSTGEIINLSTGREFRTREVAALIVKLVGSTTRLTERESAGVGSLEHLVGSPARAERLLGWRPRVALEDGLRRTIEAHRYGESLA